MNDLTLQDVLNAAQRSGIAHNNGAGGEYVLAATEAQLLKFANALPGVLKAKAEEQHAEYTRQRNERIVSNSLSPEEKPFTSAMGGAHPMANDVPIDNSSDD